MYIHWDMSKDGPAQSAEAVAITNDSTDLTDPARAFLLGVAGNLKVTLVGGGDMTFAGLLAGQIYPIAITKVFSGGTTANSIIALR